MLWTFALIVFLPAPFVVADANSCLNSTESKFHLSCSDDGKIFDINITSALGDCGQSSCHGNTPQLILQKLSCYWRNNCTIDFPKDIIVQSTHDSDKCTGTKPDILLLYSWKCTNESVQIYDFTEKTDFNMLLDRGILRSHSRFPWDYFFSDFCTDCKRISYSRTVTFWLKPTNTFVITVHKVNVTDPDSLTWHTKQDSTHRPVSVGTMIFDDSAEAISLQLNLTEDSNGDSGFLICYEYSSKVDAIKDACDNLTTIHDGPGILKSEREKDTPKHIVSPSGNTSKDACSDLTTSLCKPKMESKRDKDTQKRKGSKKKGKNKTENKGKNKTENNGKQKSGSKPKGKKRLTS